MKKTIDPNTSIPYYEQIRAYLLAQIESGAFAPNTQIPSERSLSEQFGVSRMTVKHAIQELVNNGRLYTRIGKGTFVSEAPILQQLNTLTGFSEDMERLGKPTNTEVLCAEYRHANDTLSRQLQIAVGAKVAYFKRLRLVDREPVALERSYLNAEYCPQIVEKYDFARQSLYAVLRSDYKLYLNYADQNIKARLANPQEAELLRTHEGFPILEITRVTHSAESIPLEYVESTYRGDRYVFRARLSHV